MSATHVDATNEYLQSTQLVLFAGRQLQNYLEAAPALREYAVSGLELAAQRQTSGASGYRAFMSNEMATTPEEDQTTQERLAEDTLVTVMADLQVANVLLSAGQALGEIGPERDPGRLQEALLELDRTSQVLNTGFVAPLSSGLTAERYGFTEAAAPAALQPSENLPAAIKSYREQSNQALSGMVKEAADALNNALKALEKVDSEKVLQALSQLNDSLKELPKIGRLFKQGIDKLQKAITDLIEMIGNKALELMQKKLSELWGKLKDGKLTEEALEWAFGKKSAQEYVEQILSKPGLNIESLDQSTLALKQLILSFSENMAVVKGITAALGFAAAALGVASALIPAVATAAPGVSLGLLAAYLVVIAAVVLIGMDYTDAEVVVRRVKGVREIAGGLAP